MVLPGLYVALLAVALGWALKRWYDPVPPRILALFALLPFLLFGRALLGGECSSPWAPCRTSYPTASSRRPSAPSTACRAT